MAWIFQELLQSLTKEERPALDAALSGELRHILRKGLESFDRKSQFGLVAFRSQLPDDFGVPGIACVPPIVGYSSLRQHFRDIPLMNEMLAIKRYVEIGVKSNLSFE